MSTQGRGLVTEIFQRQVEDGIKKRILKGRVGKIPVGTGHEETEEYFRKHSLGILFHKAIVLVKKLSKSNMLLI